MVEADLGTERSPHLFSGKLRIEDKVTHVIYETELNIVPDGNLREISLADAQGEQHLSTDVRVDAAGRNFLPSVFLETHDGRQVRHQLVQKATPDGETYFSLGQPPVDVSGQKAVKTDFRVTIKEPRFPGRDLQAEFLASHFKA